MENGDTREYAVTIIDADGKPYTTYYHTGEEELIQYIRDCCERYGMENSDPDPDAPFTVMIKRIPKSSVPDIERDVIKAIFGSE